MADGDIMQHDCFQTSGSRASSHMRDSTHTCTYICMLDRSKLHSLES